MSKSSARRDLALKLLKFLVMLICVGGFCYQTLQFLFLYWTYPTVVDIQEISPSYLEMPAFTICNPIGYDIDQICEGFNAGACTTSLLNKISSKYVCKQFAQSQSCLNGSLPDDYKPIAYARFLEKVALQPEDHDRLRYRLEDYLTCTIEFAGTIKSCNMHNVMGSFYSKDDLPQYCYTLNSLWGKPEKKRELIQKGATMKFHFFLNASRREYPADTRIIPPPRYNLPTSPAVQIAVHSPYFLPSAYVEGTEYLGGRAYDMKLTMKESHLLPSPYQTNCTDYMEVWKERGGKAPINQLGIIQECRLNKTYHTLGCIPITLDYPHNYTICRSCEVSSSEPCSYNVSTDECTLLADSYNQPCDSMSYTAIAENKVIYMFRKMDTKYIGGKIGAIYRIPYHDCSGYNFWKKECSEVDVEVLFDRFQTTKLTYNPKFESLELFSVIGGYMGMWLGISLLTIYDFLGTLLTLIRISLQKKRNEQRKKRLQRKIISVGEKDAPAVTRYYNW